MSLTFPSLRFFYKVRLPLVTLPPHQYEYSLFNLKFIFLTFSSVSSGHVYYFSVKLFSYMSTCQQWYVIELGLVDLYISFIIYLYLPLSLKLLSSPKVVDWESLSVSLFFFLLLYVTGIYLEIWFTWIVRKYPVKLVTDHLWVIKINVNFIRDSI